MQQKLIRLKIEHLFLNVQLDKSIHFWLLELKQLNIEEILVATEVSTQISLILLAV